MRTALLFFFCLLVSGASHAKNQIQSQFNYLGPTMHSLLTPSGRQIAYLDEGKKEWQAVVFVGGSGTSGRAFAMLEFLRQTRHNLELRFIGVERNGFGTTEFDASLGYEDYAEDVEAVLDHLGIAEFSLFAISGGSPYAGVIAARNGARLLSVHLASSLTYWDANDLQCTLPASALTFYSQDPVAWFEFAPGSPVHRIPGFQDAAFDDAARTFNMGGQAGDPSALHHEFQLYCQTRYLPDLSAVTAPVFLYYGDADPLTPIEPHARRWQAAFPNSQMTARFYPGEGHDAQYRHLDQILVDIAGLGDKLLICDRGRKPRLVNPPRADKLLARGATLGICAWRD